MIWNLMCACVFVCVFVRVSVCVCFVNLCRGKWVAKNRKTQIEKKKKTWREGRFDQIYSFIWRLLGCSTWSCSTIEIEDKLFDDPKSWDVRLGVRSTWKQPLSNIRLFERSSFYELCSTNFNFDRKSRNMSNTI
jgi:hypothetical protein